MVESMKDAKYKYLHSPSHENVRLPSQAQINQAKEPKEIFKPCISLIILFLSLHGSDHLWPNCSHWP